MAAIQPINIDVTAGPQAVSRLGFGFPLIVGYTGQRSVLITGTGTSGIIAKSVARKDTLSLVINVTGGVYIYAFASDVVTITVPTSSTVRQLIADFNANAPTNVTDEITLSALTTGSGLVVAITETPLVFTTFRELQAVSQLDNFYDTTDTEYEMVQNIFSSVPSPRTVYLLDVQGSLDVATDISNNDTGQWYMIVATTTTEAEQQILSDYVATRKRKVILISSDSARPLTVRNQRTSWVIHDAPNDHPEASWAAIRLPLEPGQATWANAGPLFGQTPNTTATLSQLITVRNNKANSYVLNNNLRYMDEGLTTDPDRTTYIDQVRSRDWIELNLEADLLELLVNVGNLTGKIPYTNAGISQVIGVIENRLEQAGINGIIAPIETSAQAEQSSSSNFRYRIEVPTREGIESSAPQDIVNRQLNRVNFSFVESGAIHGISGIGSVVLS